MASLKVTAYLQFLGRLLPRIVLRPKFDKYLDFLVEIGIEQEEQQYTSKAQSYQIIVADAADAVSVNFSGRCKFLQI